MSLEGTARSKHPQARIIRYSPKWLEGDSVLKNSPMLAYGSQYSLKDTDLGPLEPV
jgi:hypothetical protein